MCVARAVYVCTYMSLCMCVGIGIRVYIYACVRISARVCSIISKVKLATVIEGDQKAPFSIATIQRCRGGRYSFPWIAPLYSRYAPYNEPRFPGPLANTLPTRPMIISAIGSSSVS